MVPTIQTERLRGERIRMDDREDLLVMHRDPKVMATLGGVRSTDESDRFLSESVEHWDRHGFGLWILREPGTGRYVGRAGLRHVDVGDGPEIELAYALMSEFWGRGLATEVGREILGIGFGPLGLKRLACFTSATNLGSRRVMEKLGFTFDREIIHGGSPHVLFHTHVSSS